MASHIYEREDLKFLEMEPWPPVTACPSKGLDYKPEGLQSPLVWQGQMSYSWKVTAFSSVPTFWWRQDPQLTFLSPDHLGWLFNSTDLGLLAGSLVKNPPANAGDMGSIPSPGRSRCHGATKPVHHSYWRPNTLEPVLQNKRSHHNEKPMLSAAREKSTRQQTPSTATEINK